MDNTNFDSNWETVKSKTSPKSKICEIYEKYGNCKCQNQNNKRHPFICTNLEKFGKCNFNNCRLFHPTHFRLQNSTSTNQKKSSKFCDIYISLGYCECVDKNNRQHPYLCKNHLNGTCEDMDCRFFHIKKNKKNKQKDNLCDMYEDKGICKIKDCRKLHPPICKRYKCDKSNYCKYYHPLSLPAICNFVNENKKCNYYKCYFYHPIVCTKENCIEENCSLYHRKKIIKLNDIILWAVNKNSLEESMLYYKENLEVRVKEYDEFLITNIRKQLAKNRRYDILEYLYDNNENIILNRRRFNDKVHVYSELLWPKELVTNNNLFKEEFIRTMNVFINKNFDIFCFNNKWNESIFGVIKNEHNNKLDENLKHDLCLYFLQEWENNDFILRSFKNMWQLITDKTKDKMWKYLIFLIYKNPENCISYLSKDLFKDFGTQNTQNITTKINNIIQLLSEIPKNDNDIYSIYDFVNVNWNLKTEKYIKILLKNLHNDYNTDKDNLNQNSLRYGTLLGLLYKNINNINSFSNTQSVSQSRLENAEETINSILKIVSDFSNPCIVEIFIEWYTFGELSINEEIVQRFLIDIYTNIKSKKQKFEIERKMNLSTKH